MKAIVIHFTSVLFLCCVTLIGCDASEPDSTTVQNPASDPEDHRQATTPPSLVLGNFVPELCFERNSEVRVLVRQKEDGELQAENTLPTHRYQKDIFGGVTVSLSAGKAPMSGFPKKLTSDGPNVAFQAGMLGLDWFAGAEHILEGVISLNGYRFESDDKYPLVFKVVKDKGYTYLCGRGTVTDRNGKTTHLGRNDTVNMWIERATSSQPLSRESAAQAIGRLCGDDENEKERATDALVKLLSDKSWEVRRNAIESLVLINATSAMQEIKRVPERQEEKDALGGPFGGSSIQTSPDGGFRVVSGRIENWSRDV